MALLRRQLLQLAAGAAVLPAVAPMASAQTFPARPIHWIVGQPAGSISDIGARLMVQWMSVRLGQQIVVEDRPDDSGNLATETVVRATPDGYTLLMVDVRNTINAAMYEKLPFNFIDDIAPVAGMFRVPLIMAVNPSFPTRTVAEFITYAKANPGKVKMASPGIGTPQHIAGELFKFMAGIDMVHVPFRDTASAVNDLLSGEVQVMFTSFGSSNVYIKSGLLRPLGVTTSARLDTLPDLRSVSEFVPGYEAGTWFGVGAPKGTSPVVIEKLNSLVNAVLADSETKARFADLGSEALPGSPADFGKLIADETAKWGKLVQASGIRRP